MGANLATNFYEVTAIIIFGIGFTMLFLNRNLLKKVMGFNFMDSGIFLFLASNGYISGRVSPIIDEAETAGYINPIPAGLVLTGIVVSVSVTAVMLALTVRLHGKYGTLEMDEIIRKAREEENEQ